MMFFSKKTGIRKTPAPTPEGLKLFADIIAFGKQDTKTSADSLTYYKTEIRKVEPTPAKATSFTATTPIPAAVTTAEGKIDAVLDVLQGILNDSRASSVPPSNSISWREPAGNVIARNPTK